MKTHFAVLALVAATTAPSALGDGQMTFPPPRSIDTLRSNCYDNVDLTEMATSSIEKLEKKKHTKEKKTHPKCGLRNGCRGTGVPLNKGHPKLKPTLLEYDTAITVKWDIQAAAPGYLELNIVQPSKSDKDHEVKYKKGPILKKIRTFGDQTGPGNATIKIPSAFPWCEEEGACALQFHWRSESTDQTFDTCADFTMNPSEASTWLLDNQASDSSPFSELPNNVLPETEPAPIGPTELTSDEETGPTELEGSTLGNR